MQKMTYVGEVELIVFWVYFGSLYWNVISLDGSRFFKNSEFATYYNYGPHAIEINVLIKLLFVQI